MKRRTLASMLLLAVVLVVGAAFVYYKRDRFAVLLTVPLSGIVALVGIRLIGRGIEAFTMRRMLRGMGADMAPMESHLIAWAALYWNHMPMRAGTGALALYMKRRHGLAYSRFVVFVIAMQLVRILGLGLLGIGACVWIAATGHLPLWMPLLFGAVVAGSVAAMLVPVSWRYEGDRFLLRALSQISHAWDAMRGRLPLLVRIGAWKMVQATVVSAGTFVSFRLVGLQLSYPQSVVVLLVQSFATLVSIVPAGLGVNEALAGAVGAAFGFAFADGVVANTLFRAVTLLLVLTLGPLASHRILLHFLPSGTDGDGPDGEDDPE